MGKVLDKIAYLFISVGSIGWIFSILVYKGDIRYQLVSILIIGLGIFCAHFWEEIFYKK
ncbi:hypothetical protein J7M22_04610 [Candidatus Poribacteria bacterium]|nr:hypothetical protein [Candidatus Poribacteria bacterium]